MADVIEHFAYPDEVLAALVARAKPGARFLLSTPNVAHLSVRLNLLQGRFDYVDSGILESTHLRFFTLPITANRVPRRPTKQKSELRADNTFQARY